MHNAIYQNHLALDYLLASEGEICEKFNLSNCCLQIDDKKKITDKIKKLAHVPVQTWRKWTPSDLFGRWFSALGSCKTLIGVIGLVLRAWLISPCLVALVLWSIRIIIATTINKQTNKQKAGQTCKDVIKIQTPRSRRCSLTLGGSEQQKEE
jgi:hypothetical protein